MTSKFGENIYRLRKQRGLTQEELAHEIGASIPAVSGWEKGQTAPRLRKHIDALCSFFGVSEDDLLGTDLSQAPAPLLEAVSRLNEVGVAKVTAYAADLASIPEYRA